MYYGPDILRSDERDKIPSNLRQVDQAKWDLEGIEYHPTDPAIAPRFVQTLPAHQSVEWGFSLNFACSTGRWCSCAELSVAHAQLCCVTIFSYIHSFRFVFFRIAMTMFRRRSQSWTASDGGDLALPLNDVSHDNLQLEDSALPWYPRASPIHEGIAKSEYRMTAISG